MTVAPDGAPRPPRGVRRVAVGRVLPAAADDLLVRLADLTTHGAWIPLTVARPADAAGAARAGAARAGAGADGAAGGTVPGVGTVVTMVSGPLAGRGAPGFPDRMRLEEARPAAGGAPGVVRVHKLGPVLLGDAGFVLTPLAPAPDGAPRTRVLWWEAVWLAGPLPPRLTAAPVGLALRVMMRVSLARLEGLLGRTPARSGVHRTGDDVAP